MATHSSTLAWRIPWMEEPGRLQSMGSLRVGYDWLLHFHFSLSCIGEGNGNPLQCSCMENPRDGGAWWAAVYGVTQSRTRLKWLSSSSSSKHWLYLNFMKIHCTPNTLTFLITMLSWAYQRQWIIFATSQRKVQKHIWFCAKMATVQDCRPHGWL